MAGVKGVGVSAPVAGIREPSDEEMAVLLKKEIHNEGGPTRWKEVTYAKDPFTNRKTYDVTVKLSYENPVTAAVVNGRIIVRDDVKGTYFDAGQMVF